jgi:XTP/dITP diphosphohydrolase
MSHPSKLIICTNNAHKLSEIKTLVQDIGLSVYPYTDIVGKLDIEETGQTFKENALCKVNAIQKNKDYIVLADDSGLEVDALNGRPGIHSARYGGENITSLEQCEKILEELSGETNRKANFTCVIALTLPSGKNICFEGKVLGDITTDIQGKKGFGYDPIFRPTGYEKTFAELSADTKNKLSHRGIALEKTKDYLNLF